MGRLGTWGCVLGSEHLPAFAFLGVTLAPSGEDGVHSESLVAEVLNQQVSLT